MEKIKLNLELVSSMIHTEETSSNIANIYREVILKNGKIEKIPALHGNALRGLLRNLGSEHLLTSVGINPKEVPIKMFHFLFSGGSLDSSVTGIDIVSRRNIRAMIPLLSILGSALGNEMLQGKLLVSSLLPKCKELGNGDLSYWDMTNVIRYTRIDDEKLRTGDKWITHEVKEKKQTTQMFYEIETLVEGVQLEGEIQLVDDTDLEQSCFYTLLEEFTKKPYIGGSSRIGHGKIKLLNEIDFNEKTKLYKDFLEENKEEIKKWILEYKK